MIVNEYSGPNRELALGPVYRKVVLYKTGELGENDLEKAAALDCCILIRNLSWPRSSRIST